MTTTDPKVLYSRDGAYERAAVGVHQPLILIEAPAAHAADIGKPLVGLTLTADGDYYCLIPTGGLASTLKVHFTATLNSMTVESFGPDELMLFEPRTTAVADGVAMTLGTGDGAVSTGTRQTASLSVTGGLYARYMLTLAGSPTSVVVTEAAYVGL